MGEEPVSEDEVRKVFSSERDSYAGKLKAVYGYTPEIEKEVEVTEEIYRQSVQNLDLAAVIKAVNKL